MGRYIKVLVHKKGWKHSAETKAKMSKWQQGRKRGPMSDAQKKKISEANKKMIFSPEHRRKISEAKIKENAGYGAIHDWVRRWKGAPNVCEQCGANGRFMNWANRDHKYQRVLDDYIRLCVPCHRKFDAEFNS